MERPLVTVGFGGLAGLLFIIYAIFFLSPEVPRNVYLFAAGLQVFLTCLLTVAIRLISNWLRRPTGRQMRLRRILVLSFVGALLPSLYLVLKILGVQSLTNTTLLVILIATTLLYLFKNNQ